MTGIGTDALANSGGALPTLGHVEERSQPTGTGRLAALLRSPAFSQHDDAHHVEVQARLQAIDAELEGRGLLAGRPEWGFEPATLAQVERIHNPWYVERLEQLCAGGGGWLDPDTYLGPASFDVALLSAGAAMRAVDLVLDGEAPTAFSLGRPPGHHATPERGMGFCLLNNAALAAAQALYRGMQRVAILDWDVHHGNGTQDAFYEQGNVLFCSVHQYPLYPGTGAASEEGTGKGAGLTMNVPLQAGQGDGSWWRVLDELVLPRMRAFSPELVIVSAGFDAHADDPIGGMRVTDAGFRGMAERIVRFADDVAGGRLVAVLEGGYDPPALGRSVAETVEALDHAASPDPARQEDR